MTEISEKTRLRRFEDAAYRIVDGNALIVLPTDGKLLTLNPVGTLVWDRLDGKSVGELAEEVTNRFQVTLDNALADTIAFLEDMQVRGLAVIEEEG